MSATPPLGGHRERLLAAAHTLLRDKGYARTTARDLVAVSGTNLKSIGYHFGGKDALLNAAITETFELWTERVAEVVRQGSGVDTPRELLEQVLTVLIDSYTDMRPLLMACVEAFAPALRSDALRATMAATYARTRQSGGDMLDQACAAYGVTLPGDRDAYVSILIALSDGLMIQWLCDPDAVPSAHQAMEALAGLGAIAAGDVR